MVANQTSPVFINYTLLYTPRNTLLDELMSGVVSELQLDGFIGLNTSAQMQTQLVDNPFLAGLEFSLTDVS